jgi:hypothetical protein
LRFYSVAGPFLREQRSLDIDVADQAENAAEAEQALEDAVLSSERLADVAVEILVGADTEDHGYAHDRTQERTETLLLAVAAVDAALAYSALSLSPGAPPPERAVAEGAADQLADSPYDTIAAADWLFGSPGLEVVGGGGGDPTRDELRGECYASAERLINLASDPALSFSVGMITGALPAPLPQIEPLVLLYGLAEEVGRIRGRALKFVASCFRKLAGMSDRGPKELAQVGVDCIGALRADVVQGRLKATFTSALGVVAGRGAAEAAIGELIHSAAHVSPDASARIRYEMASLTTAYVQMMDRASTTAKWLGRASPLIAVLAAPAVPIINGLGTGFVVYTLDVRLDGHESVPSRVAGLVTIVRRNLP